MNHIDRDLSILMSNRVLDAITSVVQICETAEQKNAVMKGALEVAIAASAASYGGDGNIDGMVELIDQIVDELHATHRTMATRGALGSVLSAVKTFAATNLFGAGMVTIVIVLAAALIILLQRVLP